MNRTNLVVLIVVMGVIILSGCVGEEKYTPPPESKYKARIASAVEVTDKQPELTMQNMGWYDPLTKNKVARYVDKKLGIVSRHLTLFLVYDSPAELKLTAFGMPRSFYEVRPGDYSSGGTQINQYQNNLAKAHRVWQVELIYDTPPNEDIPVCASYNDGRKIRCMDIAITGVSFGNQLFDIQFTDAEDTKEGFW